MNLEEFLSQPVGMSFNEYQDKLDEIKKLQKKCKSLLDKTVWEVEAMEVVADPLDPNYIKHEKLYEKYHAQFTKCMDKIEDLKKQLKG